ncbi:MULTISPECIES: 3-hydroxyacyl-CoA dehydrogenase family protein [Paenibacillus]|uniref:3-hydroxybutyryl-CoA dehydrogenase n=1 Tax=Paenibacillus naphthalenovorans TaxID=162209 RepID=A0A0U2W809_9BACL|nr:MULTISPECIES: 3-hydroxyacyl-CoA dehydrogenase NAD-binding domain-containing protein [Paenibacillus]ALS22590.1 3-hydroxybutyryl-CoA dehydrogenase [Paenibacillus naphthalenovorans]NTZ17794.1 3-hydroxybutyryl-CoA dehydrogenase [Paenibacillus sp. JMULE4]
MKIGNVGVVGAGLMGSGIAQVVAEAGYDVVWVDISGEQLHKGLANIKRMLDRKAEKGKMTPEKAEAALNRLKTETDMRALADADLVIEAVPEHLELKKKIFKQLEEVTRQEAILASNTSGLSVSALGAATRRPEQVIGAHFFYPAPVMGLLEVTPGLLTSGQVLKTVMAFAKSIGKTPVECKDYPGFIVNRVLVPMMNEAIFLVMEGVKPDDIDTAMKLGANYPMGPITLADFVGLDTLLATMQGLYEGFNDSKYRPSPLLVKMVEAGTLGRKTGRGFYSYNDKGERIE